MTEPVVKAKVENGIVTKAFLVWDVPSHLQDWITAPIEVGPGWRYDGAVFTPPEAAA